MFVYKSVEIHQQQTIHTRLASRQLITFISPTVPTRMCAYEKAFKSIGGKKTQRKHVTFEHVHVLRILFFYFTCL